MGGGGEIIRDAPDKAQSYRLTCFVYGKTFLAMARL
jgi:hypothetical protein